MNFSAVLSTICLLAATGQTDRIDLLDNWRFQPDPNHVGASEHWAAPDFDDKAWANLVVGLRWEDQGFPEVDGHAWYRRTIDIPADWEGRPVWLQLGAANDACTVYCNGKIINSYGSKDDFNTAWTPLIADLTPVIRYGSPNVIAIESFDQGGSGGLWALPCAVTSDSEQLPLESVFGITENHAEHSLDLDVVTTSLGNMRPKTTLTVAVSTNGKPPRKVRTDVQKGGDGATLNIKLPDLEPGARYTLSAALEKSGGQPFAGIVWTQTRTWAAPQQWPGVYAPLNVRNNFVTDLLHVEMESQGVAKHRFKNPRDGWVFISSTCERTPPSVYLGDEGVPLAWRVNPDSGAFEAMRKLTEGTHTLRIETPGATTIEVRTMPELAYCYYPATPHIAAFGDYDWKYVSRHVLPHVNTLITGGSVEQSEFTPWVREGRQWIANSSLFGLSADTAPSASEVFNSWASVPGVTEPGYVGMIVDEFLPKPPSYYDAWTDAIRRLDAVPSFANRTFYAWCGGDVFILGPTADLLRTLIALGHRAAWEKYLHEAPSETEARYLLQRELRAPMHRWKKSMPGIERQLVMCLGYLCAPPESLNRDPGVDYHVFLDMQFHMLANDPAFWNLYGVMEYSASYADEESLRFAHKLFRHYCIEGNRTRMISDPYSLPHLVNPDFAEGLEAWTVKSAGPSSIEIGHHEGYSYLQGRYPRTKEGDRFSVFTRSAEAPNRIRQTLRELQPGRAYSLKIIASDLGVPDTNQTVHLDISLDDSEIIEQHGFEHVYPAHYTHKVEPNTREYPAYFTFRRIVFKPKNTTAELVISDWTPDGKPAGAIGQKTAFNFIEVQPFHAP